MNKHQKNLVCLALGIVFTTLYFYVSDWHSNQIVIHNKSGQSIVSLLVEVSSTQLSLTNVKNEQEIKFDFLIGPDSSYRVTGELKDGKQIKYEFGYVTHNYFHCRTTIVIESGGQVTGDSNL